MKVFVAGATGVLGRRLVPLLVGAGAEVTGVARSPEKSAQLKEQGAKPVKVDLFDPAAIERAVAGHDAVINVATHVPSGLKARLPGAFDEHSRIRSEASQNIASAAMATRARVFIQESYAPAYPDCGDEWIDESVALTPPGYLRSVLAAESAAAEFTNDGGTGIVLRFSNWYGPDSSRTLEMLESVRSGNVSSFRPPDAFMSSIFIDDAATATFAALSVPAGVYNVTDDVPVRRGEALDLLVSQMGVRSQRSVSAVLKRAVGSSSETPARSHRISNARFRHAANWIPKVASLHDGWGVLLKEINERSLR